MFYCSRLYGVYAAITMGFLLHSLWRFVAVLLEFLSQPVIFSLLSPLGIFAAVVSRAF